MKELSEKKGPFSALSCAIPYSLIEIKNASKPFSSSDLRGLGVSAAFLRRFVAGNSFAKDWPWCVRQTTRNVTELIVKEMTREKLISVVQLLKDEPGSVGAATVFVSHAWDYELMDVVDVLLEYADKRPDEKVSRL
jgi:hypothetical protein